MTAHRRTLRALDRIITGLEELDASFGSLPQEAKELIDTSALQALDAAGVRKLALAVEDIVGREPDTFQPIGTVTDRVLDECLDKMLARRQRREAAE